MSSEKGQWSSNFGFIMAMIGSAVGLGSIWRFPYMVGDNGGATFIVIYTLMMLLVGIMGMTVEIAMGRNSKVDAVDAYSKIVKHGKIFGYVAIFTTFILFSIYSVLGGWTLHYLIKAITFKLTTLPEGHFGQFISGYSAVGSQLIFIAITAYILRAGVSKGIEKYSTIMNFLLLGMIIIVTIRSLTLPGAMAGVNYLLQPNWDAIKDSNIWLMATGQAFFSLSLGCGAVVTYGCYVSDKSNIIKSSIITGLTTIGMALLMGFAIFPAVFAVGQDPASGPGLLFEVLPLVFAKMPGGALFAILFFAATFFAALTSGIAMVEPTLIRIMTVTKISRPKATGIVIIILAVLGIPMALSFGAMSHVILLGRTLFDNIDFLVDKILMPLNGVIAALIAGWFWRPKGVIRELSNHGSLKLWYPEILQWIIRIMIPIVVSVAVLKPWFDKIT